MTKGVPGYPEIRDDPAILRAIIYDEKLPLALVIARTKSGIYNRMKLFLPSLVLVQTVLLSLWGIRLSDILLLVAFPWSIPYIAGYLGLSFLFAQVLLIHEDAHHSVFYPSKNITNTRGLIILLAFTLTIIPLSFFVPYDGGGLSMELPYFELYTAISGLVVAMISPYLSKLAWDYFHLRQTTAMRWWLFFLVILLITLLLIIAIGIFTGHLNPTLWEILRTSVIAAAIGGTVGFAVIQGISTYQNPDEYMKSKSTHPNSRIDQVSRFLIRSRGLTIVSGALTGLSLPILAGMGTAIQFQFSLDYITIGILMILGYVTLIISIVLFVLFGALTQVVTWSALIVVDKLPE